MNVSLLKSLQKGGSAAVVAALAAVVASLGSPEVSAAVGEAGPVGSGLLLILTAAVRAGYDYAKRRLSF